MKRSTKLKKFVEIKKLESSKSVYPGVLEKLVNDVEPAIKYYMRTGHGNWSSIRMMAPVIEVISGGRKSRRNKILREIGILYPNLFWLMYRNGLVHNDSSPLSVKMSSNSIGWGFGWNGNVAAQVVNHSHYMIDPGALFKNLKRWLENKINEGCDISIKETVLISINSKIDSTYKREFEKMLEN
jgi:hypothetical protein